MKYVVTARLEVEAESRTQALQRASDLVAIAHPVHGIESRLGSAVMITGRVSIEEAEPCETDPNVKQSKS